MATGSFTYKNVIKDDSTAERLIAAMQACTSVPLPRPTLIPVSRVSFTPKQFFSNKALLAGPI